MDLTTCSVCVLAGSAGGAVTSFCVGRRRRPRRRPARRAQAGPGRQTMRSWPGSRRRDRPEQEGAVPDDDGGGRADGGRADGGRADGGQE